MPEAMMALYHHCICLNGIDISMVSASERSHWHVALSRSICAIKRSLRRSGSGKNGVSLPVGQGQLLGPWA